MSLPIYFYLGLPILLSGCFDSSPLTDNNSIDSIVEVSGHGGNGVTGIYTYGLDELSNKPLRVVKDDSLGLGTCKMSNKNFELRNGWEHASVEKPIPKGFWSKSYPLKIVTFPCPKEGGIIQHNPDQRNGSFSPINDAWFILNDAVSFYEDVAGESPIPEKITIIPHYWYGSSGQYVRSDIGIEHQQFKNHILIADGIHNDGSGSEYSYSYATSDVLVHELTHAYTSKTGHSFEVMDGLSPNLGGWSEHFSDIMAEYYQFKTTGYTDFIHGSDHLKCTISDPECSTHVRDFKNPVYTNVNDAISPEGNIDDLEIHIIANILNYSFYLLIEDDSYGVFTIDELIKVYMNAEKSFWKPIPNIPTSRRYFVNGLMLSASDLGYSDKNSTIKEVFKKTGFY